MADTLITTRRGLTGWRGMVAGLPSDHDFAFHILGASNAMARAYEAVSRYRRDPKWGRVTGNPEAREHLKAARLSLRMARRAAQAAE
jgi:hypothetical protein